MRTEIKKKLSQLPTGPGVYFHKDQGGKIIYVGKAAVLKNRVRQYFQSSRNRDPKTEVLVSLIRDIDWIETETELDALFLEAELVKRYKPKFNIELRDDKSQQFVRINMKNTYPHLEFTRRPLDDGANYYGPYYNSYALKKALRYLRRVWPYSTHRHLPNRVCLQYHLGLCPGVEENKISSREYKTNLRKLISYLKGNRTKLMRELKVEMKVAAQISDFETAAQKRNQLFHLKELRRQIVFGDREFMDISKDQGLNGLSELLGLAGAPRRIEGYDISHMSGQDTVASMVVFTNGIPDKTQYRKFKMRLPGNDDYAHMREVISRRFSGRHLDWPAPDLLLIDGGKGQLSSAVEVLKEKNISLPAIGLAKRLEQIVVLDAGDFKVIELGKDSHVTKLLQRIRDEAHRFAISYHSTLKTNRQTESSLESIPSIGPATRKRLIKAFGSLRATSEASLSELTRVIGPKKASLVYNFLKPQTVKNE